MTHRHADSLSFAQMTSKPEVCMGKVDCRKYVEITRIENALGPARKKLMEQGRMNQSKAPVEDQKFQTQPNRWTAV